MKREYRIKQWCGLFLFVVVVGICVIIETKDAYALDYAIEHSLNAKIYKTADYGEGGSGVTLTATGATVSGWNYNESRYLQVNIMVVPKEDEVHVVEIKIPSIFYAINDVSEVPNGFSKVQFIKNSDFLTNNDNFTYTVNKRSGTVRYYLKPNMTKATIQMELRYDTTLWDKIGSSPLTATGVDPIKVSIGHEKEIVSNIFEQNASVQRLSKAYSGTSLASTGAIWYKRNWNERLDYWDASAVFEGPKSDKVRMLIYTSGQGSLYLDKYYKKIIVEVDVPYYNKGWGNDKTYLEYDKDTFLFNGAKELVDGVVSTNGNAAGKLISSSQSKIKFAFDDVYGRDGRGMTVDFNWPSGFTYYGDQAAFKNGKVTVKVISNEGKEVKLFTINMGEIRYQTKAYENVYTYGRNFDMSNTIAKYPEGAITKLGGINICNAGTKDSTPKTLKYTFNVYQLVQAINLPTEVDVKYYDVTYTLKDDDGNRVCLDSEGNKVSNSNPNGKNTWTIKIENKGYGLQQVDNIFTQFKIKDLPKAQHKYHFDTISYTLSTIRRRCHLNSVGEEMNSVYSGGVYFGKLTKSAISGRTLYSYLTIKSPSSSGIGTVTHTLSSKVVKTETAPYGIDSASFSKDTIKAGESVYTSGKIMLVDWFYGADCTWIHDIRLGIELPKGVSISKNDVDIRTSTDNKKVEIVNFKTKKVSGKTIYIIDLPEDFYVGYYTKDMKELAAGGYINYTIKLKTDGKMDGTSLFTDEMMYLVAMNQPNAVAQNRIMYARNDIYDINENGSTSDVIGRAPIKQSMSCSIAPNPSALDISDSVNIIGEGSTNGVEATTYNKNDIIQYDLNIESNNDGKVSSFEYYIPIPKKNSMVDSNMVVSTREDSFDLQLVDEVTVQGDDIYRIEYCIKEGYTYDTLKELEDDEWYDYSELEIKGISLSKITAIKVSIASGNIEKGMDTTISVNMKYLGDRYYKELGLYNEWKSCGYYDYDDGVKNISGHYATSGVIVTLDGEEKINDIQLGGDSSQGEASILGGGGEGIEDNSEESNGMYYLFEAVGYTKDAKTNEIAIKIEREDDSVPVELAFSYSADYTKKTMYLNDLAVIIKDELGNKVFAKDGVYSLNANREYTIVLTGSLYSSWASYTNTTIYLHSLDGTDTATKEIQIRRITAFVEY